MPAAPADGLKARLAATFAEEEERGVLLAHRVRLGMLLFVGGWLVLETPPSHLPFFLAFLLGFVLLGFLPLRLRRIGRWRAWHAWLFPLLDAALLTVAILTPNPLDPTPHPLTQRFGFGNDIYFYLFIVASVFTYSPRLIWWTGVASAVCWSLGGLVMLTTPGALAMTQGQWLALPLDERVRVISDPLLVHTNRWGRQVVMLLLVSWGLAVFVWRVRALVERSAVAERARANLARYFSANLVDDLAAADEPLQTTTSQDCAVLFADVVGFTQLAATMKPPEVIAFLREFHARMERAVFAHDGTLDKYIGDGVMATFGTPTRGPRDATNALACARVMVESIVAWNRERAARGADPVGIGVGVHFGPIVLGDIGGPHRFEFAAVGDSVNVASRLERLTRKLDTRVLVSEALVAAVRAEGCEDGLLADLDRVPNQTLRGRDAALAVWRLRADAPQHA